MSNKKKKKKIQKFIVNSIQFITIYFFKKLYFLGWIVLKKNWSQVNITKISLLFITFELYSICLKNFTIIELWEFFDKRVLKSYKYLLNRTNEASSKEMHLNCFTYFGLSFHNMEGILIKKKNMENEKHTQMIFLIIWLDCVVYLIL